MNFISLKTVLSFLNVFHYSVNFFFIRLREEKRKKKKKEYRKYIRKKHILTHLMKFSNKFSFLFSHQALSSGKTCPIKDDLLCDAHYMLLVCKLNV